MSFEDVDDTMMLIGAVHGRSKIRVTEGSKRLWVRLWVGTNMGKTVELVNWQWRQYN